MSGFLVFFSLILPIALFYIYRLNIKTKKLINIWDDELIQEFKGILVKQKEIGIDIWTANLLLYPRGILINGSVNLFIYATKNAPKQKLIPPLKFQLEKIEPGVNKITFYGQMVRITGRSNSKIIISDLSTEKTKELTSLIRTTYNIP